MKPQGLLVFSLIFALSLFHANGFLEEELPLKIITTTPVELSEAVESIEVSGQQAITVVFSRPVIALGSDFAQEVVPMDKTPFYFNEQIPGSFRWVTTYIARWDPEGEWPSDWDVELIWNEGLTTWDNVPFNLTGVPASMLLQTPTQSFEVTDVDSEVAKNLTDNEWGPYSDSQIGEPEVPPDGILRLSFSSPVNYSMLNDSFVVLGHENDIKVLVFPCTNVLIYDEIKSEEGVCAQVMLEGDLEVARQYELMLPQGTKYHPLAGPLRQDISYEFYGLKEFRIPFELQDSIVRDPDDAGWIGLQYRRFDLWLLHGLDESVTLEDLKSVIILEKIPFNFDRQAGEDYDNPESVDFELELINKGRLQLTAQMEPSTNYRISTKASEDIIDGFGLPLSTPQYLSPQLLGDKFMVFNMRELDNVFTVLQPESPVFEDAQGVIHQWPLLSRNVVEEGGTMSVWAVTQENLMDVIYALYAKTLNDYVHYDNKYDLNEYIGKPDQTFKGNTDPLTLEIVDLNAEDLLSEIGTFLTQQCCEQRWMDGEYVDDAYIPEVVRKTSFNYVYMHMGDQVFVFVTDLGTGQPLVNVSAELYQVSEEADKPMSVVKGETDSEGVCTLDIEPFDQLNDVEFVLVLKDGEGRVYFEKIEGSFYYASWQSSLEISVVKDRELVRPGETLKIKGYIRENVVDEFRVPDGVKLELFVEPGFSDGEDHFHGYYYFGIYGNIPKYDPEFGSFVAEFEVPKTAVLREYSVNIGYSQDSRYYNAYESFTVADPRPPTSTLDVTVPSWVRPNGSVEVQVQATSLIGATVEAKMTLTWTISDMKGVETITTDASGKGTFSLDLGLFGNITTNDNLQVGIEWIGPTRERITQDKNVPVQLTDKVISFSTSYLTEVPGIEFEFLADVSGPNSIDTDIVIYVKNVTDIEDLNTGYINEFIQSQYGLSDEDILYEVGSDKCIIGTSCRYALPDIGEYLLAACIEEGEETICKGFLRGKSYSSWLKDPLSSHDDLTLDVEYRNGDEFASLQIEIPYENVEVFVLWGNELSRKSKRFALERGLQEMEIPIGEECIGECSINVAFSIPRQSMEVVQPIAIPTSVLFDPSAPRLAILTSSIRKIVKSTDLRVEVEVEDEVVEPGQNTTITVSVFDCNIDGSSCEEPSENTEVTIVAVDKAILEALPYSPQLGRFILDLRDSPFIAQLDDLIAPGAIEAVIAYIRELTEIDPFVSLPLDLEPYRWGGKADIDKFLKEYLSDYVTELTTFGSYTFQDFRRFPMDLSGGYPSSSRSRAISDTTYYQSVPSLEVSASMEVAQLPLMALGQQLWGAAPTPKSASSSSQVTVRVEDDFITTPLFQVLKTTSEGTGKATFNAPPNLGTFVVRAYAATNDIQFGQAQTELIVRRGVSLTAALPRGVRVGDNFQAGAVITVTGSDIADVPVIVTLTLEVDPSPVAVQMNGEYTQTVRTEADGTVEVTFPFVAENIGTADLKITVEVQNGKADALQVTFPVEGVQDPVIVASSFAVQGSESGWTEGLELPNALPGSGSVDLLAGVGRLPAIQSVATVLFQNEPLLYYSPQAYYSLSALLVKPILDSYGITDGPLYETASDMFSVSIANLSEGKLTLNSEVGLMYNIPKTNFPRRADVYLNAYGAFIGNEVLRLYKGVQDEEVKEVENLVEYWASVAQKQLIQDAIESRTQNLYPRPYSNYLNIAMVRYILGEEGLTWTPKVDHRNDTVQELVIEDLSFERLVNQIDSLSIEELAYVALLLSEYTERQQEVQDILDKFTSSTRVGGRTAYISYAPSSSYPISPYGQAMVLFAYSRTQTFNALVEKLANYLGGPLNNNGVASGFLGYSASTSVMLGLSEYDAQKGSTQPNLSVNVRSGNYTLLEATFDDASDLPIETSTPWEQLDSPPLPLDVQANGTGEATVAALLDFTPKNFITFPVYRGIHVTTIVQMADPITQAPTGPALSGVSLGSVVAVTVQVVTPDRYQDTRVRVLMPGGLEPIDPNLQEDAGTPCFLPWLRRFTLYGGYGWFSSWWCPEQETRPQVVTFDVTRIGPGSTEFNVLAVAATRGTFVMPSVKAYVIDEPEILGLSAAGYFEVCEDCEPKLLEDAITPAKECPNDCNGLGVCDVSTGTCNCNEGFGGDDCGGFAEE